MQNIRRSTKKHRKLLIVIVAVLTVGLVGSFAVWNSDDFGQGSSAESSTVEQIENMQSIIAENEPAEGAEIEYDSASTMANLKMQLWSLYYQAAGESRSSDEAASNTYLDSAIIAAAEAAVYFKIQLELAPDTINDQAKAQIIGRQATALSYTGENDQARFLFDQALELDPTSYEVAMSYLNFSYISEGFTAAEAYALSYMDLVGEDSEYYSQMQETLEQMELLDQLYNSSENQIDGQEANQGTEEDN